MPFTFTPTEISEVLLIKSEGFKDSRGVFFEQYKLSGFMAAGIPDFKQDNFSKSAQGVVRALHYQLPPKAQGKLVRVIKGTIWDVAVDIRKSSPTFKKWVGVELNSESGEALYIPPGFAHGFIALTEGAEVLYKCTEEYSKDRERGIRFNDSELAIAWPKQNYILSDRDLAWPILSETEIFD